jgi:S-disulfanyl-L-cysteine oxidoreductase SoxD
MRMERLLETPTTRHAVLRAASLVRLACAATRCASLTFRIAILAIPAIAGAQSSLGNVASYTDAQAESGRDLYFRTCANCHGEDLAGKVGPALTGRQFHQMVAAQNMTAPLLLRFIATQMPQTKPGSLTPTESAEIMAFILEQNGYPSGNTPLTLDSPQLKKIDLAAAPGDGG